MVAELVGLGCAMTCGRRRLAAPVCDLGCVRSDGASCCPPIRLPQDLDASTVHTIAMMEEGGDYGEDRAVHTNQLAPLLSAGARSVQQLALTIAEPPNADLAAALRAATRVTSLRLRFTSREWAAQGATRLDCSLLGGMKQLRTLSTDAAQRLDNPTALAAVPLAELLMPIATALPAIAPHTPGLTRLQLARCSAEGLHSAEAAVGQALHRLTALRCLELGGRNEMNMRSSPETIAMAGGMQELFDTTCRRHACIAITQSTGAAAVSKPRLTAQYLGPKPRHQHFPSAQCGCERMLSSKQQLQRGRAAPRRGKQKPETVQV